MGVGLLLLDRSLKISSIVPLLLRRTSGLPPASRIFGTSPSPLLPLSSIRPTVGDLNTPHHPSLSIKSLLLRGKRRGRNKWASTTDRPIPPPCSSSKRRRRKGGERLSSFLLLAWLRRRTDRPVLRLLKFPRRSPLENLKGISSFSIKIRGKEILRKIRRCNNIRE